MIYPRSLFVVASLCNYYALARNNVIAYKLKYKAPFYDIFLKFLSKYLPSTMPHIHKKTGLSAKNPLAYFGSIPQSPSFDMIVN